MAILTSGIVDNLIRDQGLDVVIPGIYTTIGAEAFKDKSIAGIEIPESIIAIENDAFSGNRLSNVYIPDSVETIGSGAFSDNQLETIRLPIGLSLIKFGTFNNNLLTNVIIPDSVRSIGTLAFHENPTLKKISVSKDVNTASPLNAIIPKNVLVDRRAVNDAPADLIISQQSFNENIAGDSLVATLSTLDPDSGDTHAYSLVNSEGELTSLIGAGGTDNIAFAIDGDQLKIVDSPDFETKSSYSIAISTTDFDGSGFYKTYTLTVNDLPEVADIQSINNLTLQDEISTFELIESISIDGKDIEALIVGTNKKDKITGSSGGEVLVGGVGKDILNGGGGADGFLFNQPNEYGKKKADKIKDFDSDEGDSILVDKDVLGLGKKIKLKVVTGKKASKKAAKSKKDFVYDDKKGLLYFNENGKKKGWGDGGLFAKLQGSPELGATDFMIV